MKRRSKLILVTGILTLLSISMTRPTVSVASTVARTMTGNWVMHLYLGKRLFDDKVHVVQDASGKLSGTLTVPDRFTVPLRNIKVTDKMLSFDIEADEGKGPFHVKYDGTWHATENTFIGFATVTDDGSLLGGFVGQKLD